MNVSSLAMRALALGVPVAAAVGVLAVALQMRDGPRQAPLEERARTVRVLEVKATTFTPRVSGFGPVVPARTWTAVAQVPGRIDYINPDLRGGAILAAGTELIRISEQDYRLAVDEAEANLKAAEAKLVQIEVQAANAQRSRDIEERSLRLSEEDLARKRALVGRGTVSQTVVDETERAVLQQRARVQDIENTLRLSPVEIEAQKRQIDVSKSRLETAKLNLERTRIALPFAARIASVGVERTQFVAAGSTLATADDIATAEVTAQISQSRFRTFVQQSTPENFALPTSFDADAIRSVLERLGWRASVRLRLDEETVSWPAAVVRTSEAIDPKTRSVGAIVSVDAPYAGARPGARPPLVKGTFVEVVIEGRPLEGRIVVPRSAVHGDMVYAVTAEDRLELRKVKVAALQGDDALIASGLEVGERIVLSDIAPAISGMRLRIVEAATGSAGGSSTSSPAADEVRGPK